MKAKTFWVNVMAIVMICCVFACVSTRKYGVRDFKLYSNPEIERTLENVGLVIVKDPFYITKVDGNKLAKDIDLGGNRTYDVIELEPGKHVLTLKFEGDICVREMDVLPGVVYLVDFIEGVTYSNWMDWMVLYKKSCLIRIVEAGLSRLKSPDGKRDIYINKRKEEEQDKLFCIIEEQSEKKSYDILKYRNNYPVFNKNGKRLAFISDLEGKWVVVADGKEGKSYDGIDSLTFSPDGQRLAYFAKQGGRSFLVVDNEEGEDIKNVHTRDFLTFSPDSKRIAYRAIGVYEGHQLFKVYVVVDRKISQPYIISYRERLLPTKREPFAPIGGGMFLYKVSYTKLEAPSYLSIPIFSPDSKKIAYCAMKRHVKENPEGSNNTENEFYYRFHYVIDDVEGKAYDNISTMPVFSPDSSKIAYAAAKGKQWHIVVNGEEGNKYNSVQGPIFSPDSESLAYKVQPATDFDLWMPVVNGKEIPRLGISIGNMKFSEDGNIFSYQTWLKDKGWKELAYNVADIEEKYSKKEVSLEDYEKVYTKLLTKLGEKYTGSDNIPPGKGLVYFYRPSAFVGSALQLSFIVNDESGFYYIPMVNGGYYTFFSEPGEIEIISSNEITTLHIEEGEVYYVKGEQYLSHGVGDKIRSVFVPNEIAIKEISGCKLIPEDSGRRENS